MRCVLDAITWIGVLVVIAAFCMPWVTLEITPTAEIQQKGFFERIKYNFTTSPTTLTATGYELPDIATSSHARLVMSFTKHEKIYTDMAPKSYFLYGVPLLAVICGLLELLAVRARFYSIVGMLLSGVVGVGGIYKLTRIPLSFPVLTVTVREGVWTTLITYVCMCICCLLVSVIGVRKGVRS